MTVDPSCWAPPRVMPPRWQPQVTTGPEEPAGLTKRINQYPPIEGDIHVNTQGKGSYVYDHETGWTLMGAPAQPIENSYWGRGYGDPLPVRGQDPQSPVDGEAYVAGGGDDPSNPGEKRGPFVLYYFQNGNWGDPPHPVQPGDDYTDVLTGRTWALS